ncbi:MAG: Nramp family divalent metal transporter [Candidatus Kapabacteria bacterium]|nr:Nramp family divalent metal transporter [Candidatus Kapabacteria bacterium]
MINKIKSFFENEPHSARSTGLEIFKYIGPGLMVTVGFIDPGNWASNVAAGAGFSYNLLWMVTLSTIMLIFLQHNAAHLGITTGLCLSEASTLHLKPVVSRFVLSSAVLAGVATALAEIMGGAIALLMIFNIPIKIGAVIITFFVGWMIYSNSYRNIEKWIIGLVSLIGFSFVIEVWLADVNWSAAVRGWLIPAFPTGSLPVIMSVLGAVVMPHNLFLHSEIIQSRQWNLADEKIIKHQLKFEFTDTLVSMIIGWAINSAMILVAAAIFFKNKVVVTELQQAQELLKPLLGNAASIIFAIALLAAGVASSVTAGMAGGTIFAGIFSEPYDIKDRHSKTGVGITLVVALLIIFLITDSFSALIYSQMILSIQLPITIFLQIYLTSSKKVMGTHANHGFEKYALWTIGIIVTMLNIALLIQYII